tara:strand:- start:432 stop:617 length:186 start_codon:yes stop_codon:yes gene_type:complete
MIKDAVINLAGAVIVAKTFLQISTKKPERERLKWKKIEEKRKIKKKNNQISNTELDKAEDI